MLKIASRRQPGTAQAEDDHQEEDSTPDADLTDPEAISRGGRQCMSQPSQGENNGRNQNRRQHDHGDKQCGNTGHHSANSRANQVGTSRGIVGEKLP